MADVVQYKLERMVVELDDLEKCGIFTRREIAEIVKQRRKFEFRLKRPCLLKQDYIAYIDYEKQVNSLRYLRRKALNRQLKKSGNKKLKTGESDHAGVSRILDIYRLATTKFKGDLQLWFQYLDFCKQRPRRFNKVMQKALRLHPKVPEVWLYAAAWEFDERLDVKAAQNLMRKGLRVCPKSEVLWVEYLRMELTYLNKLKARKVALGEEEGSLIVKKLNAEEKEWREENRDLFMSIEDGKQGEEKGMDLDNEQSKKHDAFQEIALGILSTVYEGAINAIPSSIGLRLRLYEIVDVTNFSQSEDLKKQILDDMRRDFASVPEYWEWLAKIEFHASQTNSLESGESVFKVLQLHRPIKVYEEAIKYIPAPAMFKSYISFLMSELAARKGEQNDANSTSHSDDAISHILNVFEQAQTTGCLDEDLACQYVSLHLQVGRLQESRTLAKNLCAGTLSNAVQLWTLRVSIEMRCATENSSSPSKEDLSSIFQLLNPVLRRLDSASAESLWLLAIKFFVNNNSYFDKLVDLSYYTLAKGSGNEHEFSLSSTLVNLVLQKDGIQRAREMYNRFLALPRPGLTLYRTCIELESQLASVGNQECLKTLRKLFESALATYTQDLSLWQDYYAIELKMGTSESASAVHWRARKNLGEKAALITSSD